MDANDHRWNIFYPTLKWTFLSFKMKTSFTAQKKFIKFEDITVDGKVFVKRKCEVLYGSYFFLSNEKIEHTREVFDLLKLGALFGGLFGGIYRVFFFIGLLINERLLIGKLVSNILVCKEHAEKSETNHEKNHEKKPHPKKHHHYSFELLAFIRCCLYCCFKKRFHNSELSE